VPCSTLFQSCPQVSHTAAAGAVAGCWRRHLRAHHLHSGRDGARWHPPIKCALGKNTLPSGSSLEIRLLRRQGIVGVPPGVIQPAARRVEIDCAGV